MYQLKLLIEKNRMVSILMRFGKNEETGAILTIFFVTTLPKRASGSHVV